VLMSGSPSLAIRLEVRWPVNTSWHIRNGQPFTFEESLSERLQVTTRWVPCTVRSPADAASVALPCRLSSPRYPPPPHTHTTVTLLLASSALQPTVCWDRDILMRHRTRARNCQERVGSRTTKSVQQKVHPAWHRTHVRTVHPAVSLM
jgi:hypothetical protein